MTFSFGNPYSVTYSGLDFKIEWGKKRSYYNPDEGFDNEKYKEWQKSVREKEVSSLVDVRGGYWNDVEVVISPATSEEIGYIELSSIVTKTSALKTLGDSYH